MPSLVALTYLGWRAIAVEPVKRLFQRGTGLARFQANFADDRLAPTSLAEREVALLASRCIGCGLCEAGCRLPGVSPALRALGLPAAFRLVGRASADLALAGDLLAACRGCAGCESRCPMGLPIGHVVEHLASRGQAQGRGNLPQT